MTVWPSGLRRLTRTRINKIRLISSLFGGGGSNPPAVVLLDVLVSTYALIFASTNTSATIVGQSFR